MYVIKCFEIVCNCVVLFYMYNGLMDWQFVLVEGLVMLVYCKVMLWFILFLCGIKLILKLKDFVKELVINIY